MAVYEIPQVHGPAAIVALTGSGYRCQAHVLRAVREAMPVMGMRVFYGRRRDGGGVAQFSLTSRAFATAEAQAGRPDTRGPERTGPGTVDRLVPAGGHEACRGHARARTSGRLDLRSRLRGRVMSERAKVWTAPYTVSATDEAQAREYIERQALRDYPEATVEFVKGPARDKGPRGYWRATVRRTRVDPSPFDPATEVPVAPHIAKLFGRRS